ncbi:MAG: hypothetical protein WC752_01325 [Patescibacteria group bacterium]|jgi:hypothetical protein
MRGKILYLSAFLSVLLLLGPVVSSANTVFEEDQDGSVRTSLELYGGYVADLEVGPDSAVYVGFNSPNGFFYSTDGATTWNGLPAEEDVGTIANIDVSSTAVYFIGGINLYRSEDGGATWEQLSPQNVGNALYYGQSRVFVGMRDGTINISSDGGDNFTNVIVDSTITSIGHISAAATTNDVYVLGQTGENTLTLFKSADNGATWATTGITLTGSSGAVDVKPTDANFIVLKGSSSTTYTTTGVTGTWSTLTADHHGSVVFSGDRIYAGPYYTDNNGTDWTALTSTTTSATRVKDESLGIDPNNTAIMYIESMTGVARTSDSGTTWAEANDGLLGITVYDLAQSADQNTVWLAAYGGLAKTINFTDANPTWSFPITANSNVDYATAVWMNPDDINNVVSCQLNNIYYSTDGGTTWVLSDAVLSEPASAFLETSDGILYAAYPGGVQQSTDHGVTWTAAGLTDIEVNVLTVDADGDIYAGVGDEWDTTATKRGIYKYDGATWTQLTGDIEGQMVNDIMVIGDAVYAASGETNQGGVFKSTDAGATWTDLTANGLEEMGWYHALATESGSSDVVYVSTARPSGTGSIYKSTDAGENFSLYYTGLKDETFNAMVFSTGTTATGVSALATAKTRGLVTGTNTGVYVMHSNAQLNFKANKYNIALGNSATLTATLKDSTTKDVLAHKKVKLYKKAKKSGTWKLVTFVKTNHKGKAVFTVKPAKNMYYQVRWKPSTVAARSTYGNTAIKSDRIRVKVHD